MSTVEKEVVSFEETTPSGIEIRYTAAPKRKYEVYDAGQPEKGWLEVPSVTTVLGVLDKPGLPWWGMKTGVEGVLELHRRGCLFETQVGLSRSLAVHKINEQSGPEFMVATPQEIIDLLTANKLTVNHVRDKAAGRGTAVHDAFELWAREGHKPAPEMFPAEERGYVEGLLAFIEDVQPEPVAAEVMVGSVEHGFAGRYDIRFQTSKECQVVYKRTPAKGAHYATLAPGLFLGDLKTSSGVYPSHSRQLEAYEAASVECGYEPTDARGIIHVSADGGYEFVRSTATAEDFYCVLNVWKSDQSMKTRRAK